MNAETKMSCCYFPTTVTFIDDDAGFLNTVYLKISKYLSCKIFKNPFEALTFLKSSHHETSFIQKHFAYQEDDKRDHRHIDININSIHKEIYNQQRFEEISVVVVDYAMPGINGSEICKELKEYRYKTILLTGEAGTEKALDLFNRGIISQYIHKNDPDYLTKLINAIQELQKKYFIGLSQLIISTIARKAKIYNQLPSCLDDSIFVNFFEAFYLKHQFTEYYLIEETGSFLLLDIHGKMGWLIVKNEADMEATTYESNLENVEIPEDIQLAIKNKTMLRHFFNNNEYPESTEDWRNFMYPCEKIEGKTTYYYSYIEKPSISCGIEKTKIAPYHEYLKKLT